MKLGIRTLGLVTATLAATVAWFSGMVTIFDDTFGGEPLIGIVFAMLVVLSIPIGILLTTLSFAIDNKREHWPIAAVSSALLVMIGLASYNGAWPLAKLLTADFVRGTAFTNNPRFWWMMAREVRDAGFYLLCIAAIVAFGNLLIYAVHRFCGNIPRPSDSTQS